MTWGCRDNIISFVPSIIKTILFPEPKTKKGLLEASSFGRSGTEVAWVGVLLELLQDRLVLVFTGAQRLAANE